MADWEEIKRLAADFQRIQLSGTSLKFVWIIHFSLCNYLKPIALSDASKKTRFSGRGTQD